VAWTFRHRVLTFGVTLLVLAGIVARSGSASRPPCSRAAGTIASDRVRLQGLPLQGGRRARRVARGGGALRHRRHRLRVVYSYFGENEAATTITLNRKTSRRAGRAFRKHMRRGCRRSPGASPLRRRRCGDRCSSTVFAVNLFGDDLAALERIAAEAGVRLERCRTCRCPLVVGPGREESRCRSTGRFAAPTAWPRGTWAEMFGFHAERDAGCEVPRRPTRR